MSENNEKDWPLWEVFYQPKNGKPEAYTLRMLKMHYKMLVTCMHEEMKESESG